MSQNQKTASMRFVPLIVLLLTIGLAALADQDDFKYPSSLAVSSEGNIYVVDKEAGAVFKIPARGGELTAIARGGAKPATPLYHLAGIAVWSDEEIAVASPATSNVYLLQGGAPVPVGEADSTKSAFGRPLALAYDARHNLIAADLGFEAVFRINAGHVTKIAGVPAPTGISIDKSGNILVVSASRRRLVSIDQAGNVTEIAAGAPFEFPLSVAAYADGTYVVADGYAKALFKVTRGGKPTVFVKGDPLKQPDGVAVESTGNTLVVDPQAKALFRITPDGKISTVHSAK